MNRSEVALEKFIEDHPKDRMTEGEKLYYRCGFVDGCLDQLERSAKVVEKALLKSGNMLP